LADTIRTFPKRKVGYVNGSVYSAGVLAISQCDEIIMENSVSAGFGSIGVLYVHMDQSGALEKAGVKPKIIRATKSVNKARVNGFEPLTEELEARIQAEADEAMVMFEGYVRRGRVGKLKSDDVFSGDEFNKKESVAYGLVDRTGSLGDAIKAARKL
jgi:protease-4